MSPARPWPSVEVDGRTGRVPAPARRATHQFPPHRVNYRANLWALRSVGVRQVLAPSAVGVPQRRAGPGHLRGPRPGGRPDLGPAAHRLRRHRAGGARRRSPTRTVRAVARRCWPPRPGRRVDGGTLVVINGPRFSSRAESRLARGRGLVGGRHDRVSRRRPSPASWRSASPVVHVGHRQRRGRREGRAASRHARRGAGDLRGNIDRLKATAAPPWSPRCPSRESDATATCACRRVARRICRCRSVAALILAFRAA